LKQGRVVEAGALLNGSDAPLAKRWSENTLYGSAFRERDKRLQAALRKPA
jgi:hypothetical protein